ncbi:hypothetical protein ABNP34_07495 [Glutamicibacter mishrai]|uniref:hypothetical protein n=1 Tax=Glutamicibacter mishrai TaxID=1775880 RepID=UPI0032EB7E1B
MTATVAASRGKGKRSADKQDAYNSFSANIMNHLGKLFSFPGWAKCHAPLEWRMTLLYSRSYAFKCAGQIMQVSLSVPAIFTLTAAVAHYSVIPGPIEEIFILP